MRKTRVAALTLRGSGRPKPERRHSPFEYAGASNPQWIAINNKWVAIKNNGEIVGSDLVGGAVASIFLAHIHFLAFGQW
jgi:hypothetical protein